MTMGLGSLHKMRGHDSSSILIQETSAACHSSATLRKGGAEPVRSQAVGKLNLHYQMSLKIPHCTFNGSSER